MQTSSTRLIESVFFLRMHLSAVLFKAKNKMWLFPNSRCLWVILKQGVEPNSFPDQGITYISFIALTSSFKVI